MAQKNDIESDFGSGLEWKENPNGISSEVGYLIDGGYDLPEDQWPELHLKMATAMVALAKAFRNRVAALSLGT